MKVLVAGAGGALGRQLVPQLVANGHDVVGLTRSAARRAAIRDLGATPVVSDALDPDGISRAVIRAEPEVVVHQLTALAGQMTTRNFNRAFAATNRLRIEGTDNLLSAAKVVGVSRFVAQSYAGWPFARIGGPVKTEEDPLDAAPSEPMAATLAAICHLEDTVTGADWTQGVVLRYGGFYGPGTSLDVSGEHAKLIRRRMFPLVGDGAGVWSFIHVEDAARATVAAVERGRRGIFNIVDDEPAAVSEWLPAVALALGAKPPRHLPLRVARLLAGEAATVMMTQARGASNAKAKRDLDWKPTHPSWRGGFEQAA